MWPVCKKQNETDDFGGGGSDGEVNDRDLELRLLC